MGEHAVVYGKPALLSAVNLRLSVSLEEGKPQIIAPAKEVSEVVSYAMDIVRKEYKLDRLPNFKVIVTSDIPFGFHLGSSAALAVATVAATMYAVKKLWNPTVINQLAYEVEKKQHGNPSGGDNTAITFGGFLWFRKELEFLKSIWQLPFRLPKNLNHFFLIDTGKPKETTGEMVELVKLQITNYKLQMKRLFDQNEEQTRRITVALKEGKEDELLDAIKIGERTLEGMGVVSKKVTLLIRAVEKAGGAAKILGGGGRRAGVGFLLCYHRKPATIEQLCKPYGYTIKRITLGGEGVRFDGK
ncbi:hypothetical protein HYV22_03765 [Candidatus Gottesmanbacteria bacterium]|nr:hypothetical protein [Candidatus Gottesmanbacteria bacterium]